MGDWAVRPNHYYQFVFVFNVPSTAKVVPRQGHSLT